jgi:hypothetical protein
MRCIACDKLLHEHELQRKALFTGEYIDLCYHCYKEIADVVPLSTSDDGVDEELKELGFDDDSPGFGDDYH